MPRDFLVCARRSPAQWIFPKGHVERGEAQPPTPGRREMRREEAGVRAGP